MNKPSQQINRLRESRGLFREPTMEEMLSNPIVRAVTADNVDPEALEQRLRSVAFLGVQSAGRSICVEVQPSCRRLAVLWLRTRYWRPPLSRLRM
jgi:hypothetical protein